MPTEKPRRNDRISDHQAEHGARQVRHAAEREATNPPGQSKERQRERADTESANATPVVTSRDLAKGHAPPEPDESSR
jgi:hypothetical protein